MLVTAVWFLFSARRWKGQKRKAAFRSIITGMGIALLAAISLPAEVRAEEPVRIAVFNIEAKVGIEQKLADVISDVLLGQIKEVPGCVVIGMQEIEKMLTYEQQKQRTGCAEESCMVEIAGALGKKPRLPQNSRLRRKRKRKLLSVTKARWGFQSP